MPAPCGRFAFWDMSTNQRIRGRKGQEIRLRHFRDNPLCVMCEAEGVVRLWEELDHIVALAKGGPDTDDNKQGLCKEHHRKKTAEDFGKRYKPQTGPDGWPTVDPRPVSREAQERRFPSNLTSSRIPVVMVCGPPASGKTTYVESNAIKGVDLVIDLDRIIERISRLPAHSAGPEWVGKALDQRNVMLRSLATDHLHARAWFVIGAADPLERERWARTLGASITLLDTPLDECIRRIMADPGRKQRAQPMIAAAKAWWTAQTRMASSGNGC